MRAQKEPGTPLDFNQVYQARFAYVCRLLRRWGVPARDLEDVVHDVFLVVHRRFSDWDPSTAVEPWLGAIAFRTASDWRRRAFQRQDLATPLGDRADPAPSALEHAERSEARDQVERALAHLDDEQRTLVVLHDLEGHPVPQLAKALGIGLNTAYSRLRLGRQHLTRILRKPLVGQEVRP